MPMMPIATAHEITSPTICMAVLPCLAVTSQASSAHPTISHGCENDPHDRPEHAGARDRVEYEADERQRTDRPHLVERVAGLERRLLDGCNCQKVGAGVCGHKRDDNPAEDPAGSMHGLRITVCFDAHVHIPRHHCERELRPALSYSRNWIQPRYDQR